MLARNDALLGMYSGTVRLPENIAAMEPFVSRLLDAGLTGKEIDVMTKRNPSIVFGIT